MSLNYPKENRIFLDDENTNHRLYRESECHAKIKFDCQNVRNDLGFEKQIFEQNIKMGACLSMQDGKVVVTNKVQKYIT